MALEHKFRQKINSGTQVSQKVGFYFLHMHPYPLEHATGINKDFVKKYVI